MAFTKAVIETIVKQKDKDGKVIRVIVPLRVYDDTTSENKYMEIQLNEIDLDGLTGTPAEKKAQAMGIVKQRAKPLYQNWINDELPNKPQPSVKVDPVTELGDDEFTSLS